MQTKRTLTGFCGVAVLTLAASWGTARADTFIKQATHTDAITIMGQTQPATDDTSTIWMTKDMACMIDADNKTSILRADKGVIYLVDHENKTYAEIPQAALGDITKLAGEESGEEEAESEEAADSSEGGMFSIKVTVTPTTEQKKIQDWNTTKYIVDVKMPIGATKTEVWASEDLKIDYEMFHSISNALMAIMPGFQEAMGELKKVKGMAVLSVIEAQVMGTSVKSTTTLLECSSDKAAPAGIFDVPKDYKHEEMMGLGR